MGQGAHDLELESSGDRGLWTLAEARLSLTVYCISVEFALLRVAVRVRKSQARLALARSRNVMGVQSIIGHVFCGWTRGCGCAVSWRANWPRI